MPTSIALMVGFIIGAALVTWLRRRGVTPSVRIAPTGIPATQVQHYKDAASSCWYCGDYECVDAPADSRFQVGDKQRICGPGSNPRWAGSCPSTTTLGDGSSWQFKGNCDCDG
jgi:hypothetical protein